MSSEKDDDFLSMPSTSYSEPQFIDSTTDKMESATDVSGQLGTSQTTVNNDHQSDTKRKLEPSKDGVPKAKPKKKKVGVDFHTEVDLICVECGSKKCGREKCSKYTYYLRHDRYYQNPFFKCPKCRLGLCACTLLRNFFYACPTCSLQRCNCASLKNPSYKCPKCSLSKCDCKLKGWKKHALFK